MNCLAGNGGTGWTLHCSLGMCGTAGTPGAAWADGLDAPAPLFLPSHWGRVQWWHCQPCSGMEPGKCTELSPGIERDQAREVKKEGRREVRQQASSTKLLCKQKVHGAEPRNLKGLSKQSQERMKKGTEAAAKQHQAPLQPGENGASRQEEEKPRDSSLSPRQPMNCLAGNGGTGWTLHCSLGMCGTAGTPGAAWADGLDAPAPLFLPSHWGRVQWWHCQPCSGMEPGKCTELSPGIERDQAREVKKEGRREVRQQASSTKLLCKQKVHGAEPRNLKGLSKQSQERMKKGTEAAAKQHQAPLQPGENGASRQEEEKPRDSSLSPRQPMNCLAGNGGTGWTLHCSLGMCGTAGTPGAAWADGLDAPAPPFLPSHWGRVQWWHCQPCSGMEPGKCTELSPGIERDQAREVKKEGRREVRQQASSTKLLCKQS
ncbi:uncharacterized protein LOC127463292 [Manacus candei]|uniref:uncharacterized protein LOC127463292 n=2 Tax=Manacus candei TaxID=415023 RepID=UPI002226557A|nr:uncharacterized protein LOC127463292 [Manacus candei]